MSGKGELVGILSCVPLYSYQSPMLVSPRHKRGRTRNSPLVSLRAKSRIYVEGLFSFQ
jgi:hypothetical protein